MYNKVCYLVLCLLVLGLAPAIYAIDTQVIKGPNGNSISEAQIIQAYQHVADTKAFVDAMLKFGTRKLVYHVDTGNWSLRDNHWALRYEDEEHMQYESRAASQNALNWRAMVLQYLPPFIGEANWNWNWRDTIPTRQGGDLDLAFVYKAFPDDKVEDALDSLNDLTAYLQTDFGKPDEDDGVDAEKLLSKRLKISRKYLQALLSTRPPGGVKLPKIEGAIRDDFAELINGKRPGFVDSKSDRIAKRRNTTNGSGTRDQGPAAGNVPGMDGENKLFGMEIPGTGSYASQNNRSNARRTTTRFERDQNSVSPNKRNGPNNRQNELANIYSSGLKQGGNSNNMPGYQDVANMNGKLNGLGNNQMFPNSQMNMGNKGYSGNNAFNGQIQNGYHAVVEGMGPLLIVHLTQADLELLRNGDRVQAAFTQDLMAGGMSQRDASRHAAQIVRSLQNYSGPSNGNQNSNQGTNYNNQGTNYNNNQGTNYNNNQGTNYNNQNNGSNANVSKLQKDSLTTLAGFHKYTTTVYSDKRMQNSSPQELEQWFDAKMNDGNTPRHQVLHKNAKYFAENHNEAPYVKLLGKNNRNVRQLENSLGELEKLHNAYARSNNHSNKQGIINEIKNVSRRINQQLEAIHREASQVRMS